MKTKISGAIVILLILSISFSSCNKEDFTEFNSENFRLVKKLFYYGSSSREPHSGFEYTYDKAGNMVKESYYSYMPDTILHSYSEYEYSGNKKVKEKIFDGRAGSLEFSAYYNYTYHIGDKLAKEELYRTYSNSLINGTYYEYDERVNLVREYRYDPDRGIYIDRYYSYDNQNRLILEKNYRRIIMDTEYFRYTYDDYDRLIKTEYLHDNDLYDYVEEIYNGTNKSPEKTLYYGKDGNIALEYLHFYDEWGNIVETLLHGCPFFKRKYENDLLIEEISYDSIGGCYAVGIARYVYEKF